MTVAGVRPREDYAEIMFVESARIFRLLHSNPARKETLRKLRAAGGSGRRVRVRFDKPNGGIIEGVE